MKMNGMNYDSLLFSYTEQKFPFEIMNFQTKKKESSTSQKKQTEARNNVKCHYQ